MRRGEIRWYRFKPPDKNRPVLILTRDSVIEYLTGMAPRTEVGSAMEGDSRGRSVSPVHEVLIVDSHS